MNNPSKPCSQCSDEANSISLLEFLSFSFDLAADNNLFEKAGQDFIKNSLLL